MRLALAGAILAISGLATAAPPSPLAAYVDHARVVVIAAAAAAEGDSELRRQEAALGSASAALSERQVVIIRAVGSRAYDAQGAAFDAAGVRAAAGLSSARFGVALFGKDGGVKLRSRKAVSARELFETIDAMPMRRQEMRHPSG